MKIITWNCNMAFRNKAAHLLKLNPDILIVPECEHPYKLKFNNDAPLPTDIFWEGTNRNKGLGVFSYNKYKFKLEEGYNNDLKNILPLSVTGGEIDFTLFAIWANNPADKEGPYVTQVWKAIHYYSKLLTNKKVILIGDFNSNTIWDRPSREGNHSTVVSKLESLKIYSTYHAFHNQIQGKEKHPTFFTYRHKDKPYHLDYCFASAYFMDKLQQVDIGTYKNWSKYSDHNPLSITFNL